MKRVLSLVAAVMLLLSFTACCMTSDTETLTPGDSVLENDTPAAVVDPIQNNDVTIEETVLLDEAGIKITAKSLNLDSFWGAEVKLLIENTSGVNLTVQTRNVSVNGYMIDPIMSVDVADGKKANDSMSFSQDDLEMCGIETIADIEFSFYIFTSDDWNPYFESEPIQLKTSAAETYSYTFDDSGEVVYDNNGIKIVVKGLSEYDSILGPGIIVYIHNNSEKNITVQTRDVSINGFMVDAIFSSDIAAGKHCVDSITFFSSDLEENDISQIQSAELSFYICSADTWSPIADTDTITMEF